MWGGMSAQRPFGPSVLWSAYEMPAHRRTVSTKVRFALVRFAAVVAVCVFRLSNQLWGEGSSVNLNTGIAPSMFAAAHLLICSIKDKEALHREPKDRAFESLPHTHVCN